MNLTNLLSIASGLVAMAQQLTAAGVVGGAKDAEHVSKIATIWTLLESVLTMHPAAPQVVAAPVAEAPAVAVAVAGQVPASMGG